MFISEDDFRAVAQLTGLREVAAPDALRAYDELAGSDESVREFLIRMKPERPHWFAIIDADTSADDPALFSIDAQGRYVREHGEFALATLLKNNGLKIGQTKAAPKDDGANVKGATNPWSKEFKGDEAARLARQTSIIKSGGTKLAASLAKAAGVTLNGQPLRK